MYLNDNQFSMWLQKASDTSSCFMMLTDNDWEKINPYWRKGFSWAEINNQVFPCCTDFGK